MFLFAARIVGGKNNALLVFVAKKSNEVEGVVLSVSKGRTAVSLEGLFSPEQSETPLLNMESPKEASTKEVEKEQFKTPLAKQMKTKKQTYSPRVLDDEEVLKLLQDCPVVEQAALVPKNAQCWECDGCTGLNPPSAMRCMVGGCGMAREGGSGGELAENTEVLTEASKDVQRKKVVSSKRELERAEGKVQSVPKKKERKLNIHGKKSGRTAGSKNIYLSARHLNKFPDVSQETLYWKQHKMVPQERDMKVCVDGKVGKVGAKANQKCYFFKQSGTGMCPQVLATDMLHKSDGRCSKYCKACEKPFHDICTWVYHEAILKGFDGEQWIKEVWVRETLEKDTPKQGSDCEESDEETDSSN